MTRCVVWRPKLFPRPQITSDCFMTWWYPQKPGSQAGSPIWSWQLMRTQNLGATLTVWWTNLEECFDFSVSRDDFLSAHGPDLGWRCLNRLPAAMWIVCQALCFSTWGVKFVETARNARPACLCLLRLLPLEGLVRQIHEVFQVFSESASAPGEFAITNWFQGFLHHFTPKIPRNTSCSGTEPGWNWHYLHSLGQYGSIMSKFSSMSQYVSFLFPFFPDELYWDKLLLMISFWANRIPSVSRRSHFSKPRRVEGRKRIARSVVETSIAWYNQEGIDFSMIFLELLELWRDILIDGKSLKFIDGRKRHQKSPSS